MSDPCASGISKSMGDDNVEPSSDSDLVRLNQVVVWVLAMKRLHQPSWAPLHFTAESTQISII